MTRITRLIYFTLFALMLLMPHFSRHIGSLPRPYVESLVMLVIFGFAYLTYRLHQRALHISAEKLLESSRYLGAVNRKLPLLHDLSSDLLASSPRSEREKSRVLQNLLATAVTTIARTPWGALRIVESATRRTVKEFWQGKQTTQAVRVIPSSDKQASLRALLVLPAAGGRIDEEYSLLQAIADQAQLFYKYLYY